MTQWFEGQRCRDVRLSHNLEPLADINATYAVVYEAAFEPASTDAARVEIWLTVTGEIAIGVDSCDRVAQRLGVTNQKNGFAGGHEPLVVPIGGVLALLGLIATGNVRVRATVAPIIGLVTTKAVVSDDGFALLSDKRYPVAHWLDMVDATTFSTDRRLVSFAAWR